ncbi:transposase [Streptomyces sp. JA03]|nr:transposase [Streptomyces barringtoniae]
MVDRWWPESAAFIDAGHSNAQSEGINRVIKLVARNAFGFRNADSRRQRPGRTDVTRAAIGRQRVRRSVRRLQSVVLRFGWRREVVRA